jgi:hypothetical protein
VADMVSMYESHDALVHVATSFVEYDRLRSEGVVPEILVVDPFFQLRDR